MKYFEVIKKELTGTVVSGPVDCGGDYLELPEDEDPKTIVLGYSVVEGNDEGFTGMKFYSVHIDPYDGSTDEDEVLDRIRSEHDASEWQNHNW